MAGYDYRAVISVVTDALVEKAAREMQATPAAATAEAEIVATVNGAVLPGLQRPPPPPRMARQARPTHRTLQGGIRPSQQEQIRATAGHLGRLRGMGFRHDVDSLRRHARG